MTSLATGNVPWAQDGDSLRSPMPELVIETSELSDSWTAMTVEGEIDLATADDLGAAIEAVRDTASGNLVVDLNKASFMDSTGLKTIVMASRSFADEDRELVLAVEGGPISRLIDLSGVDSSIRVVPKPDDVLDGR